MTVSELFKESSSHTDSNRSENSLTYYDGYNEYRYDRPTIISNITDGLYLKITIADNSVKFYNKSGTNSNLFSILNYAATLFYRVDLPDEDFTGSYICQDNDLFTITPTATATLEEAVNILTQKLGRSLKNCPSVQD